MTGKGRQRPNYGSGRIVKNNGYVYLWKPGHPLAHKEGYVAEHRYVLYEAGVEVPKGASVHHRNGDRRDNRLENLQVIDPVAHAKLHIGPTIRNQHGEWAVHRQGSAGRAAILRANPSAALHGRESTYRHWSCRCEPCKTAARAAERRRIPEVDK